MDLIKSKIMPNRALIRIDKKERDNIFNKEITRDDGTNVLLAIRHEKFAKEELDSSSTYFCRTGEVLQVGRQVREIEVGDIAILDYKADNDLNSFLGYDDNGKYIAPIAVTEYLEHDIVQYANRQVARDIITAKKGEIQSVTNVIGSIRNGVYHSIDPYVLLKWQPPKQSMFITSGIYYEEQQKYLELEVLAVSNLSREKFGITKGCTVKVLEQDTFLIELPKEHVLCCNDSDIRMVTSGNMSVKEFFTEILK